MFGLNRKFYIVLFFSCFGFVRHQDVFEPKIGDSIDDFSLKSTSHHYFSTKNNHDAKGFMIVFTCNHCPFAKLYTKRLNNLAAQYKNKSVILLAVNSMDSLLYKDESFFEMQQRAKSEKYQFQYLQDGNQKVAKMFGAKHTPQAFVVWKENGLWVIKYKGAIDDDGENPDNAHSYLAHAVDELLAGKTVSNPETESYGCKIFYRK